MTKREEIEARRAERAAALEAQRDDQELVDLEALDALEEEHGPTNVARVVPAFTAGLPTFAVARLPRPEETKRYRARLRPPDGKMGDPVKACEELAAVVVVYPDKPTFAKMCEARPNLAVDLGAAAAGMTRAHEAVEGKG